MIRRRKFENYIVIGTGTIAFKIAIILKEHGLNPLVLISRSQLLSPPSILNKHQIQYEKLDKDELTHFFEEATINTFVVSAGNRYLFPKQIVKKENLYIINYHAALLPSFPGRNAEAWCIYEGASEGGITWHEIDEGIDTGNILEQRKVEVKEDTTSISLLRAYSKLAEDSFRDLLPNIISGKWEVKAQTKKIQKSDLYFSWQRPANGIFDTKESADSLSRLLRAFDYGPLNILGPLRIVYDKEDYNIKKYSIKKSSKNEQLNWLKEGYTLRFSKEGLYFELKVEKIENE